MGSSQQNDPGLRAIDGAARPPRAEALWRLVAQHRETWLLLVVLLVGRVVAIAGAVPLRYFDSAEYTGAVDLSGRGRRTWPVPLFFELIPGDDRLIIWTQAVLGALGWWLLAVVLWAMCKDRWVGRAVAITVAALALTVNVTNWDSTILSEPLTILLTLVLVALVFEVVRRPSVGVVVGAGVVAVPWLALRQNHVLIGVGSALLFGVSALWCHRTSRRDQQASAKIFAALAVILVVLSGFSWIMFSRNTEIVDQNLTTVFADRILPDAGHRDWFVERGMPLPSSGDYSYQSLDASSSFQRWVKDDGPGLYVRFLSSHPGYAIGGPLGDLTAPQAYYQRPPTFHAAMLATSEQYGFARRVLPATVEDLLFAPGTKTMVSQPTLPNEAPREDLAITEANTGSIVLWLVLGTMFALVSWRRFRAPTWVALALLVISWVAIFMSWHASSVELNRHALVSSITLRVALIALVGGLVDQRLQQRRERDQAAAEGPSALVGSP